MLGIETFTSDNVLSTVLLCLVPIVLLLPGFGHKVEINFFLKQINYAS